MPNNLTPINSRVMENIRRGKLTMRPRLLFLLGSIITFVGLVASVIISTFFIGLIRFSLRTHGPMGDYRLTQIWSGFPWWSLLLAVAGLVIGIWLLRRYEFSYKRNFVLLVVGFLAAIVLAGWLMDAVGLNDLLLRRGPTQGLMRGYLHQNTTNQGAGWRWKI